MNEATHRISACYFPAKQELDLTWEDIETGERAGLTVPNVVPKVGLQIAKTVPPCVYGAAVVCASAAYVKQLEKENGALKVKVNEQHKLIQEFQRDCIPRCHTATGDNHVSHSLQYTLDNRNQTLEEALADNSERLAEDLQVCGEIVDGRCMNCGCRCKAGKTHMRFKK